MWWWMCVTKQHEMPFWKKSPITLQKCSEVPAWVSHLTAGGCENISTRKYYRVVDTYTVPTHKIVTSHTGSISFPALYKDRTQYPVPVHLRMKYSIFGYLKPEYLSGQHNSLWQIKVIQLFDKVKDIKSEKDLLVDCWVFLTHVEAFLDLW